MDLMSNLLYRRSSFRSREQGALPPSDKSSRLTHSASLWQRALRVALAGVLVCGFALTGVTLDEAQAENWNAPAMQAGYGPRNSRTISAQRYYAYVSDTSERLKFFTNVWVSGSNWKPNGTKMPFKVTAPDGTIYSCAVVPSTVRSTVTDANLYQPGTANANDCLFDLDGMAGVWTIDLPAATPATYGSGTSITIYNSVDISVFDSASNEITGRVWIDDLAPYDSGTHTHNFWVVAPNGATWSVVIPDMEGAAYSYAFNALGNNVNCVPQYQSVMIGASATPSVDGCTEVPYHIFLNPPAADLPTSSTGANGVTYWVKPTYVSPGDPVVTYQRDGVTAFSGTLTAELTNFVGQYLVEIDADGNGSYDDAADVVFTYTTSNMNTSKAITWDGKDGNGVVVTDIDTSVTARVRLTHVDEIHAVRGDIEITGAMTIETLVGHSPGSTKLWWDDTAVYNYKRSCTPTPTSVPSTQPIVAPTDGADAGQAWQTNGACSSPYPGIPSNPLHSWGDGANIDTWSYATIVSVGEGIPLLTSHLTLAMSADTTPVSAPGTSRTYTVTVTNDGHLPITSLSTGLRTFSGSGNLGPLVCDKADLAIGEQATCTVSYVFTQADIDSGALVLTQAATGMDNQNSLSIASNSATVSIPTQRDAGLSVTKSGVLRSPGVQLAGRMVDYTFTVTNTGNVTLTNVGITDPLAGLSAITCVGTSLAPGASTTCTASYALKQADLDAGQVANTATASGTPPTGMSPVSAVDSAVVSLTQQPGLTVSKHSDHDDDPLVLGEVITYTIAVTNTGNVSLSNVLATETAFDGNGTPPVLNCQATSLAPGVKTCTATYTVVQADVDQGTLTNTVSVSGSGPGCTASTCQAQATLTVPSTPAPNISLDKVGVVQGVGKAGDKINYTFTITNTGNEKLTSIALVDPLPGISVTCSVTSLNAGETATCTGTYTLTQTDVNSGQVINSATVSGVSPQGTTVTSSDDDTVYTSTTASLALTKTVAGKPSGWLYAASESITYEFEITNTGDVSMEDLAITEQQFTGSGTLGAISCPKTALDPGESTTCTASYVTTIADVHNGSVLNEATVSGNPVGCSNVIESHPGDVTILAVSGAAIGLTKTAQLPAGDPTPNAGDVIVWQFDVTNTGLTQLTNIAVSDTTPGVSTVTCPVTTLAPGASTTCTANYALTQANVDAGMLTNTASVVGTPPLGLDNVSDVAQASLALLPDPGISLTKTGVMGPAAFGFPGDEVDYTFTITNTGNVTLSSLDLTDGLPGITLVGCPLGATSLAPGEHLTCTATYKLTQADTTTGSVDNTATAYGTSPSGQQVNDDDQVTVSMPLHLSLEMSADTTPVSAAGTSRTYTMTVTNDGQLPITSLSTVSKTFSGSGSLGPVACDKTALAVGEQATCTVSYAFTQADIDAGLDVVLTQGSSGMYVPGSVSIVSNNATVSIPVTRHAGLSVTKAGVLRSAGVPQTGQMVDYTFTVTNTGNVTLTNVGVSDPLAGLSAITCPGTTLDPGSSTVCTASYALKQTDLDAGQVANTATASATPPTGMSPLSGADSTVVSLTQQPGITVSKHSDHDDDPLVLGEVITYTIVVTNTGNVSLSNVVATETDFDGNGTPPVLTCQAASLAPGVKTCTATYTVVQADVDQGTLTNTVTVTSSGPGCTTSTCEAQATLTIPSTPTPDISLAKVGLLQGIGKAGDQINYTFTITNTGNEKLTSIALVDPLPGISVTCSVTSLNAGETATCTGTYTLTQTDVNSGQVSNTATVSGVSPQTTTVNASDSDVVHTSTNASLALTKNVQGKPSGWLYAAGDNVTYEYGVTNTGDVTVTGLTIVEKQFTGSGTLGAVSCPKTALDPGESTTCAASYVTTVADVQSGTIYNQATAQGTPIGRADVVESSPDDVTILAVSGAAISLTKTAQLPVGDPTPNVGDVVVWQFEVTNTGLTELTNIAVSDTTPGVATVTCPLTVLPAGGSTTCTASYALTQADVDSGTLVNTASVVGTPPPGLADVTDTATASLSLLSVPGISLTKTGAMNPAALGFPGDEVDYDFTITNTGNVTLTGVNLTDGLSGVTLVGCPSTATLIPGEQLTCTALYNITLADVTTGNVLNTATVSGTTPAGSQVSDNDQVSVSIPVLTPHLTLSMSADTSPVSAAGTSRTYTVTVTNDGDITVTGLATQMKTFSGSGTLGPVVCDKTVLTVGEQATCTVSYVFTQADINAGVDVALTRGSSGMDSLHSLPVVSNDATVTIPIERNAGLSVTKTGALRTQGMPRAGQILDYTLTVTNTGNVTLTNVAVSDPLPGLSAITCSGTTLAPGRSLTCTASYTIKQADIDTGQIANTATASATPPTGLGSVNGVDSDVTPLIRQPGLTVSKHSDHDHNPLVLGEVITYTIAVTNPGNMTLSNVVVSETEFDGHGTPPVLNCQAATLAPGEVKTCTTTYTVVQADVDQAVGVSNTVIASASGTGCTPTTCEADYTLVVPSTPDPSVTIAKVGVLNGTGKAGDRIDYTFTITNTGNQTLTSLKLDDPLPGITLTCPLNTLIPGQTTLCTGSYTLTQADVNNGIVTNTVTVSGSSPSGAPVRASDSDIVHTSTNASLSVTKTVAGKPSSWLYAAGETITYEFGVTNTGDISVEGLTIVEKQFTGSGALGAISCLTTTLDPGESTTCTASYVTTVADVQSGAIYNEATAQGTLVVGGDVVESHPDDVTTPAVSGAAISLTKTAQPPAGDPTPNVGDVITWKFNVTNIGLTQLTNIVISDATSGVSAVTCPVTVLSAGDSTTCTATYTLTQGDVDKGMLTNTATATGTPPPGLSDVTDTTHASLSLLSVPGISLTKTGAMSPAALGFPDDEIDYAFTIINTGNVTLSGVALVDGLPGITLVGCPSTATLIPGGQLTCTATYNITLADITAGNVLNTATAHGTTPSGKLVNDSDHVSVSIPLLTPHLTLDMSADTSPVSVAGTSRTYTITVTNDGQLTVIGLATQLKTFTGSGTLGPVVCDKATLLVGGQATCTVSYVFTQADIDAGVDVVHTQGSAATDYLYSLPVVSNDATVAIPVVRGASLSVTKTGVLRTPGVPRAGQMVDYTFTVKNTGNVTLTNVALSDPLPGLSVITCSGTTLAPGRSMTCTASYALKQADINAGQVANTATATATSPSGLSPINGVDSDVIPLIQQPGLTVSKHSDHNHDPLVLGEVITYTVVVTNTGNVTLSNVVASETAFDGHGTPPVLNCQAATLAPGDVKTCTATYTVIQADVDQAGGVSNTVHASGSGPGCTVATCEADNTLIVPSTPDPSVSIAKVGVLNGGGKAGDTIDYTFTITNTGNQTLTSLALDDPLPGITLTCSLSTLIPGETAICTGTYTLTQADVNTSQVTNTATISGSSLSGTLISASDSDVVHTSTTASLTVTKTVAGKPSGWLYAAGDNVTYEFGVTNTGDVTVTGLTIAEKQFTGSGTLGAVTCPKTVLDPGDSTTCTATYVTTVADVQSGTIYNEATAQGTLIGRLSGVESHLADVTIQAVSGAAISLTKAAKLPAGDPIPNAGDVVTWEFGVTNTGLTELTNITVTDTAPGVTTVTCPLTSLAPGDSTTCTANYALTQADIDSGTLVNMASVMGTPPPGLADVYDTATASLSLLSVPGISLTKTGVMNPAALGFPGDEIDYDLTITNTGNVTLSDVNLADGLPGIVLVGCPTGASILAPGDHLTCTATYNITLADITAGNVLNTATTYGTSPTGAQVNDNDQVIVSIPGHTPHLTLDMSADTSPVSVAGTSRTYTITVTNDGQLTVIGLATQLKTFTGSGTLGPVVCDKATLLVGGQATCTVSYVFTQADIDAGVDVVHAQGSAATDYLYSLPVVSNDATVTIPIARAASLSVTETGVLRTPGVPRAGHMVDYTITVTNTGNVTLTNVAVSDPLPGLSAMTCSGSTLAPGRSMTCTASYALKQADIDAGQIANTATASATPPSGLGSVNGVDSDVIPLIRQPGLTVSKHSDHDHDPLVLGEVITYTIVVTNTGNVTLSNVTAVETVFDGHGTPPALNCVAASLAPGDVKTCTATYTVIQDDVDQGGVSNTVSASGAGAGCTAATCNAVATIGVPSSPDPSLSIAKVGVLNGIGKAGDTIDYKFTITNTGNQRISSLALDDPLPGITLTCSLSTLIPGETAICTGTYTLTQADVNNGQVTNTATVSGSSPSGTLISASDSDVVHTSTTASLTVTKTVAGKPSGWLYAAGDNVTYEFGVTNTGNVTVTGLTIVEKQFTGSGTLSAISCAKTVLDPGDSTTCTATYVTTVADVQSRTIYNEATAQGTLVGRTVVVESHPDDVTIQAVSGAAISLTKTAQLPAGHPIPNAGDVVTWEFGVTNTGLTELTNITVTDTAPGVTTVTCPLTSLPSGDSTTCTANYALTQADIDSGTLVNMASVTGTPPQGLADVYDTATASLSLPSAPGISLTTTGGMNPAAQGRVSDEVDYTFVIENIGNVTLTGVDLVDGLPGIVLVGCPQGAATLAPGEQLVCTATYKLTQADIDAGSVLSTAVASGTSPTGQRVSGNAQVSVPTPVPQPGPNVDTGGVILQPQHPLALLLIVLGLLGLLATMSLEVRKPTP